MTATTIRLYGLPGCGPCEVARLWLRHKGLPFEFMDLRDENAQRRVAAGLASLSGSPRGGVVLEYGGRFTALQGVSPAGLERWYRAQASRERD